MFDLNSFLTPPKTIAVVGLSDKPERPSYQVASYLQQQGFKIVPVNPTLVEVLGEKAYPSLLAIPAEIQLDIVDVFRQPEAVMAMVDEIITSGRRPLVWLQEGVISEMAKTKAEAVGLTVVMNQCLMKVHRAKMSK
ncbi:MAG TPA: CoA-binding protein [Candidatus Pacebacteria bacterium]|nr:CoA-binding protein [Candidatus Paceibacterota bacterium]